MQYPVKSDDRGLLRYTARNSGNNGVQHMAITLALVLAATAAKSSGDACCTAATARNEKLAANLEAMQEEMVRVKQTMEAMRVAMMGEISSLKKLVEAPPASDKSLNSVRSR